MSPPTEEPRIGWATRIPAVAAVGACTCFVLGHELIWCITETNVRVIGSTTWALESAFRIGAVLAALASLVWLRPDFRPSRRVLIGFYWSGPALLVYLYLERIRIMLGD